MRDPIDPREPAKLSDTEPGHLMGCGTYFYKCIAEVWIWEDIPRVLAMKVLKPKHSRFLTWDQILGVE